MIKRVFCILLSLMLMVAASLSLAEDAAAPAEEQSPVLLVTVNGQEILSDDSYLVNLVAYYMDLAYQYGYDTSTQDAIDSINQYCMSETICTILIRQKAAEYGLDQITDEEKAGFREAAGAEWDSIIDSFVESSGLITDSSTEDDIAAARADMEAELLENYGYDKARYVDEYFENEVDSILSERLAVYLTQGKEITDEEIQAYYNDLANEDREKYENDADAFEYEVLYSGESSFYTPEGYRAINHILLNVDDELFNTWLDLSARLEEQKEEEEAESILTPSPADAEETPAPEAEPMAEPTPTLEPVTQEMVDAAEKAILDSVQPIIDEIMAKLNAGVSFDDLIKEYGTDSNMQDDYYRATGYLVRKDSFIWDSAFIEGAMKLEKAGDISEPFVSQYGVQIMQYLRDVPAGITELTEELKEELRSELLEEEHSDALRTALDQWLLDSEIVYTEAGEAWKTPEE